MQEAPSGQSSGLARTCAGLVAAQAQPQTTEVTAGELIVEPPTLISLGFEWYVEGDADRDAAVAIAYRRAGDSAWRDSLPLLRVQNERTFYVETLYYTAPNMFAGSVFELDEDTEYEVRFTLTDPDGVSGNAQRVVNVRTRAEPRGVCRRHDVSRLSVRLRGREAGAGVHGPARGVLQENALGGRLEPRGAAARAARGHEPSARRCLQGLRPLQLQPRDPHPVRHVLRHAVGTARSI